jgi:hypothetical protein
MTGGCQPGLTPCAGQPHLEKQLVQNGGNTRMWDRIATNSTRDTAIAAPLGQKRPHPSPNPVALTPCEADRILTGPAVVTYGANWPDFLVDKHPNWS